MIDIDPAARQLADIVSYWIGRAAMYQLADGPLRDIDRWAAQVVADLTSGDDLVRAEAAQTAAEWSSATMSIPDGWWATPLGRLVLASRQSSDLDSDDDAVVSVEEACDILGVTRSRIYALLDEGKLRRGPGRGEVLRASVGRRLVDLHYDDLLARDTPVRPSG